MAHGYVYIMSLKTNLCPGIQGKSTTDIRGRWQFRFKYGTPASQKSQEFTVFPFISLLTVLIDDHSLCSLFIERVFIGITGHINME